MADKMRFDFGRSMSEFITLRSERSEFEAEWRDISDFLLPGRGVYQMYSKPRKKKLTSKNVVNTTAKEALKVLTSGLQGGLTSPSRPWLELGWQDQRLKNFGPLKDWLYECQRILEYHLQQSNFYPVVHSFYTEYAGFGTGSVYVGSDSDVSAFRFELLTAGEYAFATNAQGRADKFYRVIFMTPRQMYDRFGAKKVSRSVKDLVEKQSGSQESKFLAVLECVVPIETKGMPFTQIFWEMGGANQSFSDAALMSRVGDGNEPLGAFGFHEFPYPVARWDLIGSDIYGMGPGSEALPEIKRLQQMEKAFLMATHKDINPPLNAPSYMRGKLQTLPGSFNYYRNPGEKIESIYNLQFNYQGVSMAIERVENRIRELFFNDIFLTSARDPNASPMKAAEVHVKEGEKMLRLGPVIERLQNEFIEPIIERCFNILLRAGEFPELSDELAEMAGDYEINLVSPLAQAQKLVASKSIEMAMAFAAQSAQIDPQILDKFNIDASVEEYVDAHGAPRTILRSQEEVEQIRQNRAQQQAQEQQKQEQLIAGQAALQGAQVDAQTAKTRAEAGQIMSESLLDQQALGGLM